MYHPSFKTIQLNEMDQVKMMNRTDQKYWFNCDKLSAILNEVQKNYFMLDIDGESVLPYYTTYFDTYENQMYLNHHNGRLNRFKIRRRTYVKSGISFLEIKHKNNKGRTLKTRIYCSNNYTQFSTKEEEFIASNSPYQVSELTPRLINQFNRLTLVNKNFKERCTIDFDLQFKINNERMPLDNIAIVELKADGNSELSPLAKSLRDHRIKSSGFSKYCTGRMLTDAELKNNRFKTKLRAINKTIIHQD
ncbi:MAG: polyphosphate polymerase domain-containing protein [Prolixibacteraceae bacterium]|nr:polyphosphate polymerase domain-containing protein [Prolixibacteraceae bacterium]